ncbi:hypothetical protein FNV43_RR19459 [Rhamnella rubrinervis]|uniref:Uncharacterized protein n=1 Tax=Rhamnella rubrinervis TaxID=2594499 RepID=A0A8K0DSQ0_9ROSA|nr:hypothetical protein FNV43_RR19459 [Rhamnella rubrinervis]
MRSWKPRRRWTSEEEAALRAGVLKHGVGWWKDILVDSEFNTTLSTAPILISRRTKEIADAKPKAANSDGLSPAQTSTASGPVARGVDKGFLIKIFHFQAHWFDEKIFEAFSTLKEQNVLDTNTITITRCGEDDDDYINELPDEILVPKLEFFCGHEALKEVLRPPNFKMYEYVNLVNQVVKLHDTATLEALTIRFPLDSNYSHDIDRWVEYAARKQVKKLELDFCMKSRACTVLSYRNFLASPAASRLYWLKDLYLRGINVYDGVIESLFSNSPFIERLSVIDSQLLFIVVVADAPNLKYLKLSHCNFLSRFHISAPNLNIIRLHLYNCATRVNISAPILSRVSVTFDFTISAFSSEPSYNRREILKCLQNLLGQFSHVNKILSLIVSRDLFHVDYKLRKRHMDAKWMDEDILKKVKALANVNGHYSHQHLKVVELVGFTGCVSEVEVALYLVEIAPSLEKIVIDVCELNCCWIREDVERYIDNEYGKFCRRSAEVLRTLIRPEIDVEIFSSERQEANPNPCFGFPKHIKMIVVGISNRLEASRAAIVVSYFVRFHYKYSTIYWIVIVCLTGEGMSCSVGLVEP